MILYYPTTSLNFNDILSTESISPGSFYAKRTFGTSRHFKTEFECDDNYTILFNKIPYFKLIDDPSSEYDEYPIVLAIEISPSESKELIDIGDGRYATSKTIYIFKDSFNILFFSDEHISIVTAKSLTVNETKTLQKYSSRFRIIDKSRLFNYFESNPVNLPEVSTLEQELFLFQDKFFNSVKGMLYSYLAKSQVPNIIQQYNNYLLVKKRLDEIQNIITSNSLIKDNYTEYIYDQLRIAEKYALKGVKLLKELYKSSIESLAIFSFSEIHDLKINTDQFSDEQDLLVFEIIINNLLQNPRQLRKENIPGNSLLNIIELIKDRISISLGDMSTYYRDISLILKRAKDSDFDITIESIKSVIMKNFFCFILKYSNIDEFKKFIESKNITNGHIAYSFLGAHIGFADLSKILTNVVFSSECTDLTKMIDGVLRELRNNINSIGIIPSYVQPLNDIQEVTSVTNNYNKNSITENIDSNNTSIAEYSNNLSSSKSDSINHLDCVPIKKQLYIELHKLKQIKTINRLIKENNIELQNKTKINIEDQNSNIELRFRYHNSDCDIIILLANKKNVTSEWLLAFKTEVHNLGITKDIYKGSFPVFKCYKRIQEEILSLDDKDEIELLNNIKLLI